MQGRVIEASTGLQLFARLARRTWWTIADQVRTWAAPSPLWASAATVCHRGGCAGDSPFRSDFQAAEPAGIDYHADNPDSDLGVHFLGYVVDDVKLEAWDSGECDEHDTACEPGPEHVNDVRLTVRRSTTTATRVPILVLSRKTSVSSSSTTTGPFKASSLSTMIRMMRSTGGA